MVAVWEEMARVDTMDTLPSNFGGEGRRQSREFASLLKMFEKGGGERESQPSMRETENLQPSFSFPKLQQVGGSIRYEGWWAARKRNYECQR